MAIPYWTGDGGDTDLNNAANWKDGIIPKPNELFTVPVAVIESLPFRHPFVAEPIDASEAEAYAALFSADQPIIREA